MALRLFGMFSMLELLDWDLIVYMASIRAFEVTVYICAICL